MLHRLDNDVTQSRQGIVVDGSTICCINVNWVEKKRVIIDRQPSTYLPPPSSDDGELRCDCGLARRDIWTASED